MAPGGDRVALLETSGLDGAIRILDLETGEILITIPLLASDTPGFSSGSAVLCWSADARTIVFLWPPEGLLEDVRLYTVPASGGTPILVTGGGTGEAGIFHISCAG